MQHELFPPPEFSVTPDPGRSEPRLWVRRLVVFRSSDEIIRDVRLKPGLNIVWSPDPGRAGVGPIGHGAGKTMFCRLLRFCLGEDSFAPEGQRIRIWQKLPAGRAGAEVVLDGECWAVVRGLGPRRKDVVIKGGSLDAAVAEDAEATGIGPLTEAITQVILKDAIALIPASIGPSAAWEAALAWITRDQECRFGHPLEWRDPNSDSRSPVRGRAMEDRLGIVRAMVGALTSAEIDARKEESERELAEKKLRSEFERLDWQIQRARADLVRAIGSADIAEIGSGLDATQLKGAAERRFAEVLKLPVGTTKGDLVRARQRRDEAAENVRRIDTELSNTDIRLDEKSKALGMLRSQLPESKAKLISAENPVCFVCEVPIDKALAEGCGISLASTDLNELRRRIADLRQSIRDEELKCEDLKGVISNLKYELAAARQRLVPLEGAVEALEQDWTSQSAAVRAAQRLMEDAEKYGALLDERVALVSTLDKAAKAVATSRDTVAAHRESVGSVVRRYSIAFNAVLRELVPGNIAGTVKLDGRGLSLSIEMGGERSTAAIDSLSVVAFDLAALVLTIEGHTSLPGLLVHDSPREADLGRSIYDCLFAFGQKLEGVSSNPLFQYIITTTTEPPREFQNEQYLRLTIRGAPAEERLLEIDL